jgi:hypothetical protein
MVASPPIQQDDDVVEEAYNTETKSAALVLGLVYLFLAGCAFYGAYYVYHAATQPIQNRVKAWFTRGSSKSSMI